MPFGSFQKNSTHSFNLSLYLSTHFFFLVFELVDRDLGFDEDFDREEDFREAVREDVLFDDFMEDDFGLEEERDFTCRDDD